MFTQLVTISLNIFEVEKSIIISFEKTEVCQAVKLVSFSWSTFDRLKHCALIWYICFDLIILEWFINSNF